MRYLVPLFFAVFALASACGPKTPDAREQIRTAVQQTVAALPTYTPYPPLPTQTPAGLTGLFCEYQFCIGHPADMAFFDVNAQRNPAAPSTASQGILAAFNSALFIQVVWQNGSGITDPQFMIDLILQYGADTRNGSVQPLLIGDLNVFYVPITPTASAASTLPYGGAAAWTCGGRAFAWKAYTPQPDLAKNLLEEALGRFRCINQ
jgi:hypothetical protein